MSELANIAVDKIRINSNSLRVVDPKDAGYVELYNSIKKIGIQLPINVRPMTDPETKEEYYGLVDGLQRFTAARSAGFLEVPAMIVDATDIEVRRKQITLNAVKVLTKPAQYAAAIQELMQLDPLSSVASMAESLGKSDAWVKELLGLLKLTPEIATLVDENKINITNAFALCKLPAEEQEAYVDKAMTLPPAEFSNLANTRKKEIDKAKREGRAATSGVYTPQAYLQKIGDVKAEIESGSIMAALISSEHLTTPEEAFKMALNWCLHIDPMSAADGKRKHDEIQSNQAQKKKAADEEREKKKLERLNVQAERSKLMLEVMRQNGNVEQALKDFDEQHGINKTAAAPASA